MNQINRKQPDIPLPLTTTYKFRHVSCNRDGGNTTVEINVDTSRLDVLVDEFAMFLRACGYTDDSIFKYIDSEGEL